MLRWHAEYVLWIWLLGIHFNDSEIFSVWCHFLAYWEGENSDNSGYCHYGQDTDKLSAEELITIIVRAKVPFFYKTHPDKLRKKVHALLEKYLIRQKKGGS